MKAAVYKKYGPPEVIHITEVDKPVPGHDEVLVKIRATTSTSAEGMMRSGKPFWGRLVLGIFKPAKKYRIMGIELAGEIESAGENVKKYKKGDMVYGFTGFRPGAYAEYKCMSENSSLCLKPVNLTWEEAAASVDGASTALFFLKEKANIRPGQRVIITGASGSIGTFAVQIASYFGARVTGVCSTGNIDMVKSLGAEKVIDYTKEDFRKKEEQYDIIFDTVGKYPYSTCKKSLSEMGCYLPTVGLFNYFIMIWTSLLNKLPGKKKFRRVITGMSVDKRESLLFIKELIEQGKLKTIIDRTFPLEKIVEAHRYVEKGHKKGNVVITIN